MTSNGAELAAMLANDPARALSFAHRLAGSAAVFGLGRLSQALLGIEQALRAGEIDRARAQLAPIPDLVAAAIQHLAAAA
jgi:HPt (histidine-containing phosphotransfer) domain-containing protein